MMAWGRWAAGSMVLALVVALSGCGNRGGGVVEETAEFTFDDIAAAAAAETQESESPSDSP